MSYEELINALIENGNEKIKKIWQDAEVKAAEILAEKERKIDEIKKRYEQSIQASLKEQTDNILSEAEREAKKIRTIAQQEFSKKIFDLSLSMLCLLRKERYREIFRALVIEIPEYKWDVVFVNEQDQAIAKEFFSSSKIMIDNKISGGLLVMTKDGNISIDNTFEKRLERAWNEIIPELMKEIESVTEDRK